MVPKKLTALPIVLLSVLPIVLPMVLPMVPLMVMPMMLPRAATTLSERRTGWVPWSVMHTLDRPRSCPAFRLYASNPRLAPVLPHCC